MTNDNKVIYRPISNLNSFIDGIGKDKQGVERKIQRACVAVKARADSNGDIRPINRLLTQLGTRSNYGKKVQAWLIEFAPVVPVFDEKTGKLTELKYDKDLKGTVSEEDAKEKFFLDMSVSSTTGTKTFDEDKRIATLAKAIVSHHEDTLSSDEMAELAIKFQEAIDEAQAKKLAKADTKAA